MTALLLLLLACPHPRSPALPPSAPSPSSSSSPSSSALDPQAVVGVTDPALRVLVDAHWRWQLQSYPTWASTLGYAERNDEIPDTSPEGYARRRSERASLLTAARSLRETQGAALDALDQRHLALLIGELEQATREEVCRMEQWAISARSNALVEWNDLPESHVVVTAQDGRDLLARYQAIGGAIDGDIANLRLGLADGLVPSATSAEKVVAMVRAQLAAPLETWPLYGPILAAHPDWTTEELARYRAGLARALEAQIQPALERYRAFLEAELLPHARGPEGEGLAGLPHGAACYAALVRGYTTLPTLSAEAIHQLGLDELERIHAELRELGPGVVGTGDLAELFAHLRTDPALHFESEAAVEQKAIEALAAARAAMPGYFGRLPQADCVVRRVPDYEAPYTTIAYYREPHADGSKPGEYFINTHAPETRPRFEAEVLAFHESIPGHHLQLAISQELPSLPAFRRYLGQTAFIEGWALYTERLADEMGLYSGDLDRLGMLSFDTWRAGRLVVDTGIHHLGWSRAQAEAFLRANTPLAENNIVNEVDRYISTPGQALAYKVGQLTIRRLREEAERALGERFSLPAFHDVVLGAGAVPLPVLELRVRAWVAETARP